jgi:predicted  nucleic acid-binding Zn-ribbon protein
MVKAQKRVDALTERLATVTDHAELGALGTELASAQADLDELESRWLDLAELQQG